MKYAFEDCPKPRSNHWRKWYHSKMASIVSTQAKVAKVFERIDAHSAQVQRKVYVLEGPEEHAQMAKMIVELALGAPVDWPSQPEEELDANLEELLENLLEQGGDADAFSARVQRQSDPDDDDGGDDDDSDGRMTDDQDDGRRTTMTDDAGDNDDNDGRRTDDKDDGRRTKMTDGDDLDGRRR